VHRPLLPSLDARCARLALPNGQPAHFIRHKLAHHRCCLSECGIESCARADGNTILFLLYLFCAIFVLLSMFLAMLGEAQANLRDDQRDARKEAERKGEQLPPEYGILHEGQRAIVKGLLRVPGLKNLVKDSDALFEMHEKGTLMSVFEEQMEHIDRLEDRMLSMDDTVKDLMAAFKTSMR
jgi:hypothetical protein